ncbi:MAG: hypothetical protein V3V01_13180 [Acidimicrobiales bacterium]
MHSTNRFDRILAEDACRESSALARAVRQSLPAVRVEPSAIRSVAVRVAGPVLVSFVLWVLARARDAGIERLYFLSRDGEVMLDVANALPRELTAGLELRRLEVSRSAVSVPAASLIGVDCWIDAGTRPGGFLVHQRERVSAATLIGRAGLDIGADVASMGLAAADLVEPFSDGGFRHWLKYLASDEAQERILGESQARLRPVVDYFIQERLGAPQRSALVDVGWTGQQAAMLSVIIEHVGGSVPVHLHVGRLRDAPTMVDIDLRTWLFDDRTGHRTLENPVALFETFCATELGGVTNYETRAGQVVALRRHSPHEAALKLWGLNEMRDGIIDFASSFRLDGEDGDSEDPDSDLQPVALELLEAFWHAPTSEEAQAWGSFPYERDEQGKVIQTLAVRYDRRWLSQRFDKDFHGIDWPAGSIAISSPLVRRVFALRRWLRTLLASATKPAL